MAREHPLTNGRLFVSFDPSGSIRELTYPHVGKESHVGGRICRIGLSSVAGFEWITPEHVLSREYESRAPVVRTRIVLRSLPSLSFLLTDWVDTNDDILYRHLRVENASETEIPLRVFFHFDMDIANSDIGNTASFLSDHGAMLHYKDHFYFLMTTLDGDRPRIDGYACGTRHAHREGTWRDAEDGELGGNPIAQGAVDSVYAIWLTVPPGGVVERTSVLVAAASYGRATDLLSRVVASPPSLSLSRCRSFYDFWLDTPVTCANRLPESYLKLMRHSLFILKNHMSANGAIVAAVDSDSLSLSRDTYSYLWPRDGAIIAHALDMAGFGDLTRRFYDLLPGLLSREGFLLHKYHPSRSPGSSWHPSGVPGTPEFPIQEDETALSIWAFERHIERYRDIDSLYGLYRSFVLPSAHFLAGFRSSASGLPCPSYDLWEERAGIWTFTVATVIAGLFSASRMARRFGDTSFAQEFEKIAGSMKESLAERLFDPGPQTFLRGLKLEANGSLSPDPVPDSSLSALFWLDIFSPQDTRLAPAMEHLFRRLTLPEGGVIRYANDSYYRENPAHPGNPWIIATLWKARWLIRTVPDPLHSETVRALLDWVVERAAGSGMLAEQYHPRTLEVRSASPLTWSHAEWVLTMVELCQSSPEKHPWDDGH